MVNDKDVGNYRVGNYESNSDKQAKLADESRFGAEDTTFRSQQLTRELNTGFVEVPERSSFNAEDKDIKEAERLYNSFVNTIESGGTVGIDKLHDLVNYMNTSEQSRAYFKDAIKNINGLIAETAGYRKNTSLQTF